MDTLEYLTDTQKRLLFDIVEAQRKVNKTFLMLRTNSEGDFLRHPGFNGLYHMSQADAVVLRDVGLLIVVQEGKFGAFGFVPAPAAFAAYEELHRRMGEPASAVETDVFEYFNSATFQSRHATAFDSWNLAAQLIWNKNADSKLSDVGHHCRVSLQEFTESLLACMGLVPDEPKKEKTKDRASQALVEARKRGLIGETMEGVLNSLFHYWVALYDLVCKQEHAANREPSPSDWDDARALVFLSMFVMTEFDRRLCR